MEGTTLVSENNTIRELIGGQQGETFRKVPLIRTMGRRTTLSDITNTMARPNSGDEQDGVKAALAPSAKEYISQFVKENTALLKLLGERNKIIELSSVELQKLRSALQQANQQNWQLAQANSRMQADLNLGKDRLKVMQHELGCTMSLLRAKTLELEEKKQLDKEQFQKMGTKEQNNNCVEVIAGEAVHATSLKKACNSSRKRMLRSLVSNNGRHQVAIKEKDENRRKSLRRRSSGSKSESCLQPEDLFEIEDVKVPVRSLVNDHKQEGTCDLPSFSATDEVQKDKRECPQNQNQLPRRSSIGRPMRKAAEKVSSYKEPPGNVKMRRPE